VLGALCLLLLLFGVSRLEQKRRRLTPTPGRIAFYTRSRKLWFTLIVCSGAEAHGAPSQPAKWFQMRRTV
jgi:hypothetical protein